MIHEAMILEYAGPELALVTLGGTMRLGPAAVAGGEPVLPLGHRRDGEHPGPRRSALPCSRPRRPQSRRRSRSPRSRMAKLRLFRVPEILSAAFVLSVLAVVTGLVTAMTGPAYTGPLGLAAGAVLACAVVTLWRRDLRAVVSVLALQGIALGVGGRGARRPLPRRRPGRHRRPGPCRQGDRHPGPAQADRAPRPGEPGNRAAGQRAGVPRSPPPC